MTSSAMDNQGGNQQELGRDDPPGPDDQTAMVAPDARRPKHHDTLRRQPALVECASAGGPPVEHGRAYEPDGRNVADGRSCRDPKDHARDGFGVSSL